MGLFKNASRPAKTDPVERVLTLSLPPPTHPEKPIIYEPTTRTSERFRTRDEQATTFPVRGTTRPSTPPPPHWSEEDYPKAESPLGHFFSPGLRV
jgi:hypothetical protein